MKRKTMFAAVVIAALAACSSPTATEPYVGERIGNLGFNVNSGGAVWEIKRPGIHCIAISGYHDYTLSCVKDGAP